MGQNVGEIDLDLVLQSKQFKNQLSTEVNSAMKSVDKSAGGLGGAFGKLGKLAAGAFAVSKIVSFGKECLKLGSDLAEVQNVVDVTFGSMSGEIDTFAKSAIDAYGLSETVAKKYAGTFGAMAKSFGFAGKDAVAMSETLTGLSGDVASFYNLSTDEAYTKLKSVFTGETESLKDLGVVMTQTALDQYALQNGYGKTTAKMTEQEKVALRYSFVLDKLSDASGDFSRTSDGWANQTRVLALRFDALRASIGQGLINVLTPVVKWLNLILSKLQVVADAFSKFTAMIMGKSSPTTQSTGAIAADLAASAVGAEDTASGIADAGAAAKKAAKTLMGIDELNTLQANDGDSGSGGGTSGGGGGGGGISTPEIGTGESAVDAINGKLKELLDFWDVLKDKFAEGFSIGYKEADFTQLIASLKHIGQMLKDIFTDPEVVNAAKHWAETVAKSIGEVTGSVARIAIKIGETLVGGIEKYLEQHSDDIKRFIVDMFDISAEKWEIIGNLSIALADIFENVFGTETSKELVADLTNIFATLTMTMLELSAKFSRDILDAIAQPIIDNVEAIGEALRKLTEFVADLFDTISKGITETAEVLQNVYDTYIDPMFDAIGNGLSQVVQAISEAWNTYIAPILEEWGARFSALWTEHIQPALDSTLLALGKLCQLVGILWEQYLAPFIAWIQENILPIIAPIIQMIGDGLMIFLGIVGDVITGVMTFLQGILDFLIGVFTLDWGLAWEGIKEIFSGIWTAISGIFSGMWEQITEKLSVGLQFMQTIISTVMGAIANIFSVIWGAIKSIVSSLITSICTGIVSAMTSLLGAITGILNGIKSVFSSVFNALVGIVKTPINAVIGMMNKLIGGLNSFKIDVPSWVPGLGGKSFGIKIPNFPMLANGGFVEANSPQLAMIGDNKREGEIVAPESKIAEAVAAGMSTVMNQLAAMMSGGTQAATADGTPINIYLGNELLDSMIVNSQNRRALRSGGRG